MTTPKDSRPFDLAIAKQNAPIVTRQNKPAKFITHVPEGGCKNRVVCLIDGGIVAYDEKGFYTDEPHNYDLFLAPLGYCEGKPVFVGDILIGKDSNKSYAGREFIVKIGNDTFEAFQWPRPTHVVKTRMTLGQVQDEWGKTEYGMTGLVEFANAAIARSIADGDVIPVSLLNSLANDCDVFLPTSERDFRKGLKYFLKEYLEGLKK